MVTAVKYHYSGRETAFKISDTVSDTNGSPGGIRCGRTWIAVGGGGSD
jgi:hypothetical protein